MPQSPSPLTSRPALLGTARSARIDSLDGLARQLDAQYRIVDFEPLRAPLQATGSLKMEIAGLETGAIGLTSVWGSAVALEVEPLEPRCMLALPAIGWGRYQLDGERIDNIFGETIAFLPARGWRLINDGTGGTALHFSERDLLERARAMSGAAQPAVLAARLARPLSLKLADPASRVHHRQLLHALAMIDQGIRLGVGEPHPMLRLDDLILRCIALLLFPDLSRPGGSDPREASARNLQSETQRLMEWIRAELHRPLSLTEIEARSSYGRRSLQAGFRREVGCGPMQWLRQQRLEAAYHQLVQGGGRLSIRQVAQACGYLNVSAFSRDFKTRFGRPPRQVLGSARGSVQP